MAGRPKLAIASGLGGAPSEDEDSPSVEEGEEGTSHATIHVLYNFQLHDPHQHWLPPSQITLIANPDRTMLKSPNKRTS